MNVKSFPMADYNVSQANEEHSYNQINEMGIDDELFESLKTHSQLVREAPTPEDKERVRLNFYDLVERKYKEWKNAPR
jgi:hypothetical protein